MATVSETINIIKNNIIEPKNECIDIEHSAGRVLAKDIFSPIEFPSCNNSLMDGFAVLWKDVQNASQQNPVRLRIIGESRAGTPFDGKLKIGNAVQISTGAMLPDGPDTIIPIENCKISDNFVSIFKVDKSNQFVRFKGTDIAKGETIVKQGTVLTAPLIGLLASVGITQITSYQQPNVSVIVSGNELIEFSKPLEKFQVRDSNRIMLSAAVENCGGKVTSSHVIKDRVEKICQAIETSEESNELIILSGGSSVGAFDFSKQAVKESGFKMLFESVHQKPGKSFFCARKYDTLLFGLPGQPQAAYFCFTHYIQPVIKKLSGKRFGWKKVWGRLESELVNNKLLTRFTPIHIKRVEKDFPSIIDLKKKTLKFTENIINSDGYLELNEGDHFKKDELVEVFLFPDKDILSQ